MKTLEFAVLSYLFNGLWQAPLCFFCALLLSRWMRRVSSAAEHRMWVATLLVSAGLPGCWISASSLAGLMRAFTFSPLLGAAAHGAVSAEVVGVAAFGLPVPGPARLAIPLGYGLTLLYFGLRIAWRMARASGLCRRLITTPIPATLDCDGILFRPLQSGAIGFAVSTEVGVPGAVGMVRRWVVLPAGFIEAVTAEDLKAVVAHEIAHSVRYDFLKSFVYGLIALPLAWHPATALVLGRIAESREIACDELAAKGAVRGRRYAQSLLRVAALMADRPRLDEYPAIGIFNSSNLERRIMNLTRERKPLSKAWRLSILSLSCVFAIATCAAATSFRVGLTEATPTALNELPLKVDVDRTSIVKKVSPVYPVVAKKKGQQGTVLIAATIDKEGTPTDLKIKQSANRALDRSAVDAVKQWRWKPYVLNGNPVAVETEIRVIFSLAN